MVKRVSIRRQRPHVSATPDGRLSFSPEGAEIAFPGLKLANLQTDEEKIERAKTIYQVTRSLAHGGEEIISKIIIKCITWPLFQFQKSSNTMRPPAPNSRHSKYAQRD